jgi:cytochrome c55X
MHSRAATLLLVVGIVATELVHADIAADRKSELIHLLRHDCGSCHGMRLTGGLGPPLTADAVSSKPVTLLEQAILAGRPGTPMPPWAGILSAEEVVWLVQQLRAGVPDGEQ